MTHFGQRTLGSNLTFSANTHDPATGIATDADSLPVFRVYEEDDQTAILTGSMALHDSGNTAGFYSKKIALTAANGFENGKDYEIYIAATVLGSTGTISHTFRVGTGAAAGAIEYTYTVTNSQTGVPVEGVEIWITTDSVGNNVIWNGHTDAQGIARDDNGNKPFLDPGTYYFWKQKTGFIDAQNPDTEVVS